MFKIKKKFSIDDKTNAFAFLGENKKKTNHLKWLEEKT